MSSEGLLSYDEARDMAHDSDPEVRRKLAARADVKAEILYFLAEDAAPEVRRTVAANAAAPHQTHTLLAKDEDPGVRFGLAEKLGRIAPDLSDDERVKLRQSIHDSLNLLAKDEITKVRQILSDTLKDVTNAPPDMIKLLAMDGELAVAGPVLECSPVLNDEDLLEIISLGTVKGGLNAISKRQGVGEGVSDAIVATNDEEAIADLLGNGTAQIREQTLDDLIEKADSIELWHAPLVSRPKLPSGAATRLAQFVADSLLEKLSSRDDLDDETLEAVKSMVHHRISAEGPGDGLDFLQGTPPIDVAERLMAADRLDQNVIGKALHANDHLFVFAALVVRAGIDIKVATKIFSSHSAKGVTALVWKTGLPAKLAVMVLQRMAGIAPTEITETILDGDYSMTKDELEWQLEYFNTRVHK
ncbi:MAG: DUF2336 domain-containing protein [Rhodospirillales bacterium]|nr:DUF2336 domain-containing protein [Rhodospirillales bacterium]